MMVGNMMRNMFLRLGNMVRLMFQLFPYLLITQSNHFEQIFMFFTGFLNSCGIFGPDT